MKIHATPQPLSGDELVTLTQNQNGNWVDCSMPLAHFLAFINQGLFSNLPTTLPTVPGVLWNNNGTISRS